MYSNRFFGRLIPALRTFSTLPDHRQVIMPKVSPTMTAGRLIAWKKNEGEPFAEGEDIADVESDKSTMPISAREDGYIARIFVPPDTPDIPLGQLLAITVEEEEHIAAFKDFTPSSDHSSDHTSPVDPPPTHTIPTPDSPEYTGPLGPAILRILSQHPNINLHAITPTGPKGRLLKGDVLAAIADGTAFADRQVEILDATPQPPIRTAPGDHASLSIDQSVELDSRIDHTDVPVSSLRRAIAKRLLQSKTTVPHQYASARYSLDTLLALRKRLNSTNPSPRISVNDFVIRAVGIALRRVPEMNVHWDDTMGVAVPNETVDVSMAVAIQGGLITPIVTDVDRRGLSEIASISKDLVVRAKEGTLAPEEFEGGSFSISNLGMFGISHFSAIINPPQSGILAVGSGVQRAMMGEDGNLRVVVEGTATLSTDARAVKEQTAAQFLQEFTACLSNPENMLA